MKKINQLIRAFGNLPAIYEGVKNKIFKQEEIEEIAAIRWSICQKCKYFDFIGTNCAIPGTQPCCSDCGCSISLKIRAMSSDCPKGRWQAIMTPQMEDELKKQVYFGYEAKKAHEEKLKKLREEQKLKYEQSKAKRDGSNI